MQYKVKDIIVRERQRIVAYIRARLAHATLDDRVSMPSRGVMIDLGNAIEAMKSSGRDGWWSR